MVDRLDKLNPDACRGFAKRTREAGHPLQADTITALADALEAERWKNDRLRSALITARDFIAYHPAVSGTWPLLNDLLDSALRLPEGAPNV